MKWIGMAKVVTVVASFGSMAFSYVLGSSSAGLDMGYVVLTTAFANAALVTGGHFVERKKDAGASPESTVSYGSSSAGVVAAERASPTSVGGTDAVQQSLQ
jgi:hypothetical protein